MTRVRRLTAEGIERFDSFLLSLGSDAPQPIPVNVLEDDRLAENIEFDVDIEAREFGSRMEAEEHLSMKFSDAQADLSYDQGLWAWLSLFYFDRVCPKKNGKYVPGERARWIPATTEHFRYYRHLLAGPYRIYSANRDDPQRAILFLYGPLGTVGHFYYQIVSRQEYITNPAIVQLATNLYFDTLQQRPKRGAQTRGKPGTVFRLATFLNQLDLTWDLYSMTTTEFAARLPSEYERFMLSDPV